MGRDREIQKRLRTDEPGIFFKLPDSNYDLSFSLFLAITTLLSFFLLFRHGSLRSRASNT
jgi:hypothetical protein